MNKYIAATIRKFGQFLRHAGDNVVAQSHPLSTNFPYPISIRERNIIGAKGLLANGLKTFDQPNYLKINEARMSHLASLRLQLERKKVIDIGCGVGDLAQFFVERDCQVVCLDGRQENISSLRLRYPDLDAHVVDIEAESISQFGMFDIVFAYGILYHLENPLASLRNMASVCQELLLLETQICDHTLPIVRIADESAAFSQALGGLGCRPTPSYIVLALNRIGFPFVYAPKFPPQHPEFQFKWKNNLDWRRDKHPMRCIFIASRTELESPKLINLLAD